MPVPAKGVTLARATDFLTTRFDAHVADVSRIGHGEWSQAYAFRRGDAEFIVRFSAFDEDFHKDRLAARYASPALPIPVITEIGEAFGGFYAISERATGGYLDDLAAGEMRATLPALFAALDAARQADLSATTGYGSWGAGGTAPHASWRDALLDIGGDRPTHRTYGWRERLVASPTGSRPFDDALTHLHELAAFCPDERYLIHSDLLNFNVLVAGGRITAVIDWGCAMYGDFLYDVAWFAFWSPWYAAWQGIDFAREAALHYQSIGLDVPHFAERLRRCQIHIGLAAQAYNAFKERWAALEQTARRTLEVARSSP